VVATYVAVLVEANPTFARDKFRVWLQVVILGTSHRYAQVLLGATLIEIGFVCAISVIANNVVRIPP
jgi:hypothetical protein